ncbi:unnamed protein product [Arabis nemorensis]|uniref:Pectinesterase n=1 Tax=Arabis nemorensis TaxID=586526 RepID=A0A565BLA0_9BRAS|nr:unnamed protein product [Arabis nemorensis]
MQKCTIRSIAKETTSRISGCISAHERESKGEKTSSSFVNRMQYGTGKVWLRQAWKPYAIVVFSNTCILENINHKEKEKITNGSYGEGAEYKDRVSYSKQLTDSEAASFTSISYIDGDKWLNQTDLPLHG